MMSNGKSGSSNTKSNLWMMSLAALTLVLFLAHSYHVQGRLPSADALNLPVVIDCEGDACSQVSLTWEESKQQFKAHNSSDNWVRVRAANLATDVSLCVEPSKDAYLSLKSVVAPYHAHYGQGCAAPTGE